MTVANLSGWQAITPSQDDTPMLPRNQAQATTNRTIAPTVDRLIAMAKVAGLHLTTAESLRRQLLITGTRRDTGAAE